MRALIVDDEPLARQRLRTMLADHPDVEILGESETAAEALRAIRGLTPDVVFLDVQMPGLDGFHVLDTMNVTPAPFVVFVTGQAEHAVRAFDRAAGDYLLKPYDDARLAKAVGRARAALQGRGLESALGPKWRGEFLAGIGSRAGPADGGRKKGGGKGGG